MWWLTSGRSAWEHFEKFEEALLAVALARRERLFENIDAQFGKAVYELTCPFEEARQRLDTDPDVADDPIESDKETAEGFTEARVLRARVNDPEYEIVGAGAVLGRILLGKTHWRLDAMGGARLDRLRNRFEARMTDKVRFAGERRDDMGAQMRMKEPAYDSTLVPEALLRDTPQIVTAVSRVPLRSPEDSPENLASDFEREQQRLFLDRPVPALQGSTPRQAAENPALCPALIALLKHRITEYDSRKLETGEGEDPSWMVAELGLMETSPASQDLSSIYAILTIPCLIICRAVWATFWKSGNSTSSSCFSGCCAVLRLTGHASARNLCH